MESKFVKVESVPVSKLEFRHQKLIDEINALGEGIWKTGFESPEEAKKVSASLRNRIGKGLNVKRLAKRGKEIYFDKQKIVEGME